MENAMKKWFALDIVVDAAAVEAVESALNGLDSLGSEVAQWLKTKSELQLVTGFFDELPEETEIRSTVIESLQIYGFDADALNSIHTRTVVETDWLAEWKKYWKPTVVGKFMIAPPWEEIAEPEKIVVRIEPNMAFGTGTHETTQLCLSAIGENYRHSQTLLDVGTGTGILAIAAAKMCSGAPIRAFDTDADSIGIAKENALLNRVTERIEFFHGTIGKHTPACDLVCANLTLDVIIPLLPLLLEKARRKLVLSGILVEQQNVIEAALEKFQISNFRSEILGEWMAVIISMD
jgi:ribosomal protein L11 methyltransferase